MTTNFKKRILTSLILSLLLILMMRYDILFIYFFIVVGISSILEFFNLTNRIFDKNFTKFSINILFTTFIFIFCLLFVVLSSLFQLKIILFTLLLSCIASDIGGYIFGNLFKGPKLTKISPGKTISGSLGSFILCSLTFFGIFFYVTDKSNLFLLLVGVITSLACQIGDLFFSFLKRKAKLKDTGNFLPGHGGFLDRIDGILLGVPFGFTVLIFLLH